MKYRSDTQCLDQHLSNQFINWICTILLIDLNVGSGLSALKELLQKKSADAKSSMSKGKTAAKIYDVNHSGREDVIFFSRHGPFPAYLKRFHLSDSDYCSCGSIGTALHYATECILAVSWHMRKPVPNFEQEWLKRVANILVSRQKIRRIVKFISENRVIFRSP
ncbi:hypothetical protein AVEN_253391-1 [Araneus ventricosus]|uniref:Uncharacterized protein n=1 Tax=Araneus ventricosus TaxID=182803 RepID=A0A4Y2VGI2_ARAVE|nr:hypothetical protein AVEN_253391-1 [Araneus ventricosus]